MAPAVRQRVLLGLCALTVVLLAVAMWMTLYVSGDTGATLAPSGTPFVERVSAIDPGSPADIAGLRVGDLVDARTLPAAQRFRLLNGVPAGESLTLPLRRGGAHLTITVTPRLLTRSKFWLEDGWDQVLSMVGELWGVLVAALIVWRRRDSTEAMILALCLTLLNLGTAISTSNFWISPWPALDLVAYALGWVLSGVGTVLLATYALQFARPVSRLRRVVTAGTYAINAFEAGVAIVALAGCWFGVIDPNVWFFNQTVPAAALFLAALLSPLACVVLALRDANQRERVRLAWAGGSLAILYVADAQFQVLNILGVYTHYGTLVVDLAVAVAPIGLTYALLSRRLMDTGFVLNRAAVAAVLSASGIAAFALIEWVLSSFSARLGATGVLVVNIAAAIVVGLIAPSLYRFAGALVERTLFSRQRHAREQATRIISGLPYAESTASIAKALTRDVCKCLDLPSGAVFRRGADGRFVNEEAVGWDSGPLLHPDDVDRIVLQLRADRTLLRLHDAHLDLAQHLRGDGAPALVYPLESRQELSGFVVYSLHAGGIDVDPDERALLDDAARSASRGYDALELAARVEMAYQGRMEAEAEAKETLRRANAQLERVNEAQARFVPSEFLRFLRRDSIVDVALGDSTLQTMSILFSDIRSFTTLSEEMAPPEIFAFLNAYLHRIGPLVRENNGFIDKYMGDGVMALFPGSASDALRAGVALQRELRIFNAQLERERKPKIAAGVGIHTGQLMLGTLGERSRMDTTVIADAVNVAARLEDASKTYGCSILISRQAYEALADPAEFLFRRLGRGQVKGKSEVLDLYECFSGESTDAVERKERAAEAFAVALAAWEGGDVALARASFAAIVAANRDDGPARYFLTRCEEGAPIRRARLVTEA